MSGSRTGCFSGCTTSPAAVTAAKSAPVADMTHALFEFFAIIEVSRYTKSQKQSPFQGLSNH